MAVQKNIRKFDNSVLSSGSLDKSSMKVVYVCVLLLVGIIHMPKLGMGLTNFKPKCRYMQILPQWLAMLAPNFAGSTGGLGPRTQIMWFVISSNFPVSYALFYRMVIISLMLGNS